MAPSCARNFSHDHPGVLPPLQKPEDTVRVAVDYYYCRDGAEGICKMGRVVWTIPLKLSAEATTSIVPLAHQAR